MNKLIAALFAACLLLAVNLKADGCPAELLEKTNNYLKQIDSLQGEISSKEKIVENLKSREIRSIWDVVSRNSRENSLQRRNRLMLEISALQEKSAALKSGLSRSLTVLLESIEICAHDPVYAGVLTGVIKIRADELISYSALTESEITSAGTAPEALEFLRYRLETQEKYLEDALILTEALKTSKTAFMKADKAVPAAAIETIAGEMLKYAETLKISIKSIKKVTDRHSK